MRHQSCVVICYDRVVSSPICHHGYKNLVQNRV